MLFSDIHFFPEKKVRTFIFVFYFSSPQYFSTRVISLRRDSPIPQYLPHSDDICPSRRMCGTKSLKRKKIILATKTVPSSHSHHPAPSHHYWIQEVLCENNCNILISSPISYFHIFICINETTTRSHNTIHPNSTQATASPMKPGPSAGPAEPRAPTRGRPGHAPTMSQGVSGHLRSSKTGTIVGAWPRSGPPLAVPPSPHSGRRLTPNPPRPLLDIHTLKVGASSLIRRHQTRFLCVLPLYQCGFIMGLFLRLNVFCEVLTELAFGWGEPHKFYIVNICCCCC